MSLAFTAHCNKCITPLQRGHGHVCSCSCFLCEECAKQVDRGSCPACDKQGVKVLDLGSDIVPSEVTTSLSDATARLESFHAILQFQVRHYKKALVGAHSTIRELLKEVKSLKEGYDVPLDSQNTGKRNFFEMDAGLAARDRSLSRPRSSPAAEMDAGGASPPQTNIKSKTTILSNVGSSVWKPYPPSMYGPGRDLMAKPTALTPSSSDPRERPQSSPDRNKRTSRSPTARLVNEAHQRLSPAVTPSSLYSQQGRARSPSASGQSNPNSTPVEMHRTSQHFRARQGGTGKARSPFLAIRSPSNRPGTGGSLGSAGGGGGRARTPLLGTVGAEATKEELLEQRREENELREQAKQRQEVSRFQDPFH